MIVSNWNSLSWKGTCTYLTWCYKGLYRFQILINFQIIIHTDTCYFSAKVFVAQPAPLCSIKYHILILYYHSLVAAVGALPILHKGKKALTSSRRHVKSHLINTCFQSPSLKLPFYPFPKKQTHLHQLQSQSFLLFPHSVHLGFLDFTWVCCPKNGCICFGRCVAIFRSFICQILGFIKIGYLYIMNDRLWDSCESLRIPFPWGHGKGGVR